MNYVCYRLIHPGCCLKNMSKFALSTALLIVSTNWLGVNYPALSAIPNGESLTNRVSIREYTPTIDVQLLAESSLQNQITPDDIFEDVVLNKVDKLKQFLDRGGSPNRYIHAAVNAGAIDCTKMMLSRGANVNLRDKDGLTLLMISARVTYRGGVEMTELLISKGANVNAKASKGSTALMYACLSVAAHYEDDYAQAVKLLIKHGAKVNIKNQMGMTPLKIAKEGNLRKIATMLKKAGAVDN